jgi:hypothetical protein
MRAALGGGGGGQIVIGQGAVQIVVTSANADAPEIAEAVRKAIEELIDDINRKGY